MTHTLKTLPRYWDAIERGEKNFEVRRDDRGYEVGDVLALACLMDYPGNTEEISDLKPILRRVKYILNGGRFGIEPGYVVMALEEVPHA